MNKTNKTIANGAIIIGIAMMVYGLCGMIGDYRVVDTPDSVKIQISGSTTCLPIVEECALKYMKLNPNKTVFVAAGGSSAGIRAVSDDISDIGMSSRDLKPEELLGVTVTPIAQDKIAIIVHPDNNINDITMDSLKRIYTGKTANFDYIDGRDDAIMVVTREQGSGTRSTFESVVMDNEEIADTAIVAPSNGILRKTVAGNTAGIGYISAGYVDETVKELNVDEDIGRNLYLITDSTPTPDVLDFINFVLSDTGQECVEAVGFERIRP